MRFSHFSLLHSGIRPRSIPWRELRHTLWVPAYLVCFALLESLPERKYWATQLPIDNAIPYCSWFVIPYSLWYFQLIFTGVYLLPRNRGAYHRYMRFLSWTFFASVLLWVFFPNGQDLRPAVPGGLFGPAVALLYRIDTNTNVFPSLHVVGSIGAAVAACDAAWDHNRNLCAGEWILALLITASTVFIKQHSILDVIGAVPFCAVAWLLIYRNRDKN